MKVALVALVVLAAVLGAQASTDADFAVVESALKGIANVPRCLVGIPGTLVTEVLNLAQSCVSSVQAIPICLIGAVQQVVQDLYIEFVQCVQS